MMRIQYYCIALCLSLSLGGLAEQSTAQTNPVPNTTMQSPQQISGVSTQDQGFIMAAAKANMTGIMTSQLALQKSTNPQVQAIAAKLVQDHTQANADLTNIAAGLGITVPQTPDSNQQAMYAQLSALNGPAFDQAYLQHMEQSHQEAITLFRTESAMGSNPRLKNYAVTYLPGLETHLATVDQQLGVTQTTALGTLATQTAMQVSANEPINQNLTPPSDLSNTTTTQSSSAAVSGGNMANQSHHQTRAANSGGKSSSHMGASSTHHQHMTTTKTQSEKTHKTGQSEVRGSEKSTTTHTETKETEKNKPIHHKEMTKKHHETTKRTTTERRSMVRGYW